MLEAFASTLITPVPLNNLWCLDESVQQVKAEETGVCDAHIRDASPPLQKRARLTYTHAAKQLQL